MFMYAAVARWFCESSRPFLCIWNMYYHQQRCDHKIYVPKPPYLTPNYLHPHICEDILMRNGSMECFWSEAYWQVCRSDENTESVVYRKIDRKYFFANWV